MSDYYDLSDDERHDPRDPDDEPTVAEIYQSVRDENRRRAARLSTPATCRFRSQVELESLPDDTIITTAEAASFLRVHPVSLRRWAGNHDRPQPAGHNGYSYLYRLGDLRDFRSRKVPR